MSNLENIVFEGQTIDLKTLSMEKLKEILEKLNREETLLKQELQNTLSQLS